MSYVPSWHLGDVQVKTCASSSSSFAPTTTARLSIRSARMFARTTLDAFFSVIERTEGAVYR